jgi:hypothetical protein
MKLFFSSFVLLTAALAGCAAATPDDPTGDSASELRASVTPGTFRLFDEPRHVPNAECESFTDLEIKASGTAHLVDGLGGKCALTAFMNPNPREFAIHVTSTPCGGKVYEGARRVPVGPSATGVARIKITDNRTNVCDVAVLANIIVEETVPGFPGSITTTKFSDDRVEAKGSEIVFCQENVDHGAMIRFFAGGPEGRIVRAEYTETTFVNTTVVADMRVCTSFPEAAHDDSIALTHRCNDVSWVDSFSVELYEGGFSGLPSAKLFKTVGNTGATVLVHALSCRYLAP